MCAQLTFACICLYMFVFVVFVVFIVFVVFVVVVFGFVLYLSRWLSRAIYNKTQFSVSFCSPFLFAFYLHLQWWRARSHWRERKRLRRLTIIVGHIGALFNSNSDSGDWLRRAGANSRRSQRQRQFLTLITWRCSPRSIFGGGKWAAWLVAQVIGGWRAKTRRTLVRSRTRAHATHGRYKKRMYVNVPHIVGPSGSLSDVVHINGIILEKQAKQLEKKRKGNSIF